MDHGATTTKTEDQMASPASEPERWSETFTLDDTGMTANYQFAGGALDGIQEVKDQDGNLIQSMSFKAGELDGPLRVFSDGALLSEQHYRQGKLHGPTRHYDTQGHLLGSLHYQDDLPHGVQEWKTAEGALLSRYGFEAGEKHGEQQDYYTNGKLRQREVYVKGQLQGEPERFEPNGKPVSDGKSGRLASVMKRIHLPLGRKAKPKIGED